MEPAARNILEAFDRLGLTRLGAADLVTAAGNGATAQATLSWLIEANYLRESMGQYERTEAGRLEVAGPADLTLLSRAGCHLCEEALLRIEPLAARYGIKVRVVDIDSDSSLLERFHIYVPVLFLGTRELARYQVDPSQIQAELSGARPRK